MCCSKHKNKAVIIPLPSLSVYYPIITEIVYEVKCPLNSLEQTNILNA